LKEMKPITIDGNFSSDSGWNANLKSPRIVYGTMDVEDANLKIGTKDGTLAFNTFIQKFQSGTSMIVYSTSLVGSMKNDKLDFTLGIKDKAAKDKYTFSAQLNHLSLDEYIFSLKPEKLVLNYEKWVVNADNSIQYSPNGILAKNFILSQGPQQLSINSTSSTNNAPLKIDFNNFKISTLTGFLQEDSLLANGILSGTALVKDISTQPTFTTDLSVKDLSIYSDTIGNLTAKVNNNIANTYHAEVVLDGRGNQVNINGDYIVKKENSSFDFLLDIGALQMKAVEGFSNGAIKDARGNLYGKVALKGDMKNPVIDGKLQFNNTAFNVSKLNSVFRIDKEAIAIINNEGIKLNTFTIRDTTNNTLVIDGNINSKNFLDYKFDLTVNADHFTAVNSTKMDNKLFYGKMVFSTKLKITGTPALPVIDGELKINDATDFTVVLPQDEPGIAQREGIVRFVDYSATAEDSLFISPYDSMNVAPLAGFDVSVNINVDKGAAFNLIIDEGNGDFLRLKGTAQLTGGIDASGKVTLVGSYEIEEGSYDLSFNFIKRKFQIQKGSRIVWTGEPTAAQIDITAKYVANTAPLDLVQGQIVGDPNIYKQKLPFEVNLNMDGELLKPVITFDIVLPQEKNYNVSNDIISTVQSKLTQMRQDPGEMNKQVFALLLLNRFVGENPFDNSSGGSLDAGTFAKQSVSKLLTEQLNSLAEGLVEGVDINFDLATTEDYTTGSKKDRTDFNVGISKRLLNDRLTVTVGSNFELEGPQQANKQQNNLAGNISVNYRLSKDGRYALRAYRKNDYTGALEGYVVETGIGFIINVDYNKFKQIFTSKKQRQKKREIKQNNKEIEAGEKAQKENEEEQSKDNTTPTNANKND
ncbi:MAG: translocation/assembly module TamB domain-containing protein, partial [Ginsengibacter sp.]